MASELVFFVPSNRVTSRGHPTHMDGTNEMVSAGRTNRAFAARRKREDTLWVAEFAAKAMGEQGWERPEDCKVVVSMTFVETSDARDLDNIYGGAKYVLDALCTPARWSEESGEFTRNKYGCGAIVDDSQQYVENLVFDVIQDREAPGVIVRVTKVGDER